MFKRNPEKEWEGLGKENPYYGVLSHENYRGTDLDEAHRKEFFDSGESYVAEVLNNIRNHLDSTYTIKLAIDFGCGVGRLTIPIARRAERVMGVDVSPSMLAEAERNSNLSAITNADFVKSDNHLSCLKGPFNFIHSYIVFQHISTINGINLYNRLISHLEPGGICVTHFTYASRNNIKRLASFVRSWIPFGTNIVNLIRGKRFFEQHMQMNEYDLNKIFRTVQDTGTSNCFVDFQDHSGELGVVIYFQKPNA